MHNGFIIPSALLVMTISDYSHISIDLGFDLISSEERVVVATEQNAGEDKGQQHHQEQKS